MRPRVRRLIVKLTLCTLAGAVVTWAVAWGAVLSPKDIFPTYSVWLSGPEALAFAPVYGLEPAEMEGEATLSVGFSETFAASSCSAQLTQSFGNRHLMSLHLVLSRELRSGWPAHAVHGTMTNTELSPNWVMSGLWEPTSLVQAYLRRGRPLPVDILPLGFTLNTLLAAGVLLGVTEGAGAWRRRSRRSKGKCPWCGYDRAGVAGDAPCPECGRVSR